MAEIESPYCPECDEAFNFPEATVDRRSFIRALGGAAALALGAPGLTRAEDPVTRKPRPAEALVRELHASLTEAQKKRVILDYDHGAGKNRRPTRLGMYNASDPEHPHQGRLHQAATGTH
jgi:hypothetical protein